ncbi:hypothetical protein EEB13_30355 [Rhodococcus sp. WS3]|nr:hypothetical protein EEB13_30355 [Rhodococcus sp. WS3]
MLYGLILPSVMTIPWREPATSQFGNVDHLGKIKLHGGCLTRTHLGFDVDARVTKSAREPH